jgi:NADP-dependent 3-hydroxy acid dehydrogenase YdfG
MAKKLASKDPENIVFFEMDVTKEDCWDVATKLTFSKFGRFDILANNAGT